MRAFVFSAMCPRNILGSTETFASNIASWLLKQCRLIGVVMTAKSPEEQKFREMVDGRKIWSLVMPKPYLVFEHGRSEKDIRSLSGGMNLTFDTHLRRPQRSNVKFKPLASRGATPCARLCPSLNGSAFSGMPPAAWASMIKIISAPSTLHSRQKSETFDWPIDERHVGTRDEMIGIPFCRRTYSLATHYGRSSISIRRGSVDED